MRYHENHCTECDWNASTEEHDSHTAIGRAAIDHYLETGHSIRSLSLTYPDATESGLTT
jgi:hypothetical protein